MSLIPDDYRLLEDGELITKDCYCSGRLSTGFYGWGKPPKWLVGEFYLEGHPRHPDFIAVKKSDPKNQTHKS